MSPDDCTPQSGLQRVLRSMRVQRIGELVLARGGPLGQKIRADLVAAIEEVGEHQLDAVDVAELRDLADALDPDGAATEGPQHGEIRADYRRRHGHDLTSDWAMDDDVDADAVWSAIDHRWVRPVEPDDDVDVDDQDTAGLPDPARRVAATVDAGVDEDEGPPIVGGHGGREAPGHPACTSCGRALGYHADDTSTLCAMCLERPDRGDE